MYLHNSNVERAVQLLFDETDVTVNTNFNVLNPPVDEILRRKGKINEKVNVEFGSSWDFNKRHPHGNEKNHKGEPSGHVNVS